MPSKRTLRWRREMIDAYYDDRYRTILTPLAQAGRAWEAGDLSNSGLLDEVKRVHRESRTFDSSFVGDHEILEQRIQSDEAWYAAWIQAHPRPEEDGLA